MDLATLTLFLPACFALNTAPGPNNLLSVSNSTRYGYRTACVAGIGRLLAFAGMIALASAGLAVVLQTSELLFYAIKSSARPTCSTSPGNCGAPIRVSKTWSPLPPWARWRWPGRNSWSRPASLMMGNIKSSNRLLSADVQASPDCGYAG